MFILCVEEDAYDIAYLMHKEFQAQIRHDMTLSAEIGSGNAEINRVIINSCIQSIGKLHEGAGMIE